MYPAWTYKCEVLVENSVWELGWTKWRSRDVGLPDSDDPKHAVAPTCCFLQRTFSMASPN